MSGEGDADGRPHKPAGARLTHAELLAAIKGSGYPLEVRLHRTLTDAGLDCLLGAHFKLADGAVKEIDLLASTATHQIRHGVEINYNLTAVIGVKRLLPPDRFVGVLASKPPHPDERASLRLAAVGGVPSVGSGFGHEQRGVADLLLSRGRDSFSNALSPLTSQPHCVHWAVAGRRNGQKLWAEQSQPVWEDVETAARVSDALVGEATHASASTRTGGTYLSFLWPTLVVGDLEYLHVFDANTEELVEVDWLVLQRAFHLGDGRVALRSVDIVTEAGLLRLASALQETAKRMAGPLLRHSDDLAQLGAKQRGAALDERLSAFGGTVVGTVARPPR